MVIGPQYQTGIVFKVCILSLSTMVVKTTSAHLPMGRLHWVSQQPKLYSINHPLSPILTAMSQHFFLLILIYCSFKHGQSR